MYVGSPLLGMDDACLIPDDEDFRNALQNQLDKMDASLQEMN